MLIFLLACAADPCGDGYGRADDGQCYPLAGFGDDTADTGTPDDTGSDDTGDSGDTEDSGDTGDSGDTEDSGDSGDTEDSGDSGDTGGTDTGTGGQAAIEGFITYDGDDLTPDARCNLQVWDPAYVDEATGMPDRNGNDPIAQSLVTCPTEGGVAAAYSANVPLGGLSEVALYLSLDPDGTPDTPEMYEAGTDVNPLAVVVGETYTDVDFVLP